MSTRRTDLALGLLFFSTLLGLGLVTIVLSDFRFGADVHDVEVYSDDVGFLRIGNPVLVHGMPSGKVQAIQRLDPPREFTDADGATVLCTIRILARLEVDPYAHLRRDHRILIEDLGVLGGKLLRVETGSLELDLIDPGSPLLARATPSILQAAGALIEENREGLGRAIENLAAVTEAAATGEGLLGRLLSDGDLAASVEALVANLEQASDDLAQGRGTLGQLIADDGLASQARKILEDVDAISGRLARGEGTLGKLLVEEQGYDQLLVLLEDARSGVDDIRAVVQRLAEGEGTLGKLLTDDALHGEVEVLLDDLTSLSADLRAGKGTLGRLFQDESLYDNFNSTLGEVSGAVTDLREGDGLLAALISDRDLADTFRRLVDQVLGAVEDARETAPVTSLGSFLFGTF